MSKGATGNRKAQWFAALWYPVTVKKNKMAAGSDADPSQNDGFRKKLAVFLFFARRILIRWMWTLIFVFIPSILITNFRPGLIGSYEVTTVFIWFWMITIRESLVFTEVLKVNENDMVMLRSFAMKPGTSFLGRFRLKVLVDLMSHVPILLIFRVSVYHMICLVLLTMFFRAIGERRELKSFQKNEFVDWKKRASKNKIIRIVCVCAAYGFPLAVGIMAPGWFWLIHPVVLAFVFAKAMLDWRYLRKYKNYEYLKTDLLGRSNV